MVFDELNGLLQPIRGACAFAVAPSMDIAWIDMIFMGDIGFPQGFDEGIGIDNGNDRVSFATPNEGRWIIRIDMVLDA